MNDRIIRMNKLLLSKHLKHHFARYGHLTFL